MTATARPDPLHVLDLAQARAAALIADLGDDDWGRPTPCTEWSVRDVVNKMTASTQLFAAFGRRQRPDPPPDLIDPAEILGDDPLGVYLDAAADCRAAWRGEGAMEGTAPSTVGEFPAKAVLNARIFDTTILSWDVASACSLDHRIDDLQAAYVLRVAVALVPTVRAASPERYRDPEHLDDDHSLVERMVAATGRDPSWKPPRGGNHR
ncbi:MAG: TIGR03086 family metal-binding protein [Actinomycetota bacterium]